MKLPLTKHPFHVTHDERFEAAFSHLRCAIATAVFLRRSRGGRWLVRVDGRMVALEDLL